MEHKRSSRHRNSREDVEKFDSAWSDLWLRYKDITGRFQFIWDCFTEMTNTLQFYLHIPGKGPVCIETPNMSSFWSQYNGWRTAMNAMGDRLIKIACLFDDAKACFASHGRHMNPTVESMFRQLDYHQITRVKARLEHLTVHFLDLKLASNMVVDACYRKRLGLPSSSSGDGNAIRSNHTQADAAQSSNSRRTMQATVEDCPEDESV
ncbi:hypothetical protein QBC34DRAFT_410052 [Podospora aff. communis PSN243]|uniref:Uncharacterized protein n=1 Tax=Podospora aff. communis PSN243 TaxID=3040156 RepID=A0AAV9GGY6_9PEZI|nr:hypothetical protein QBC34DRAFT_410052 [Podospora aff. communis PSN243]